jgi:pyridoxine kinase
MPTALILSSYVAAGRVGGMAQALALAALKIEPVLIPTVAFGRTPGRGPAGGGAVDPEMFQAMIDGAAADGLFGRVDAVITGHFSHPDQVAIAARVIDTVRTAPRSGGFIPVPVVVVDPILGDEPGGLYVKPEVAEAVKDHLLTRADVLTPNLWELAWLTGLEAINAAGARAAAKRLPAPALVTSVPARPGEIGLLYAAGGDATLIAHAKLEGVPRGTGDLVTAVFAAGLIEGHAPVEAAARAARAAATVTRAAVEKGLAELPIVALGPALIGEAAEIRIERLSP